MKIKIPTLTPIAFAILKHGLAVVSAVLIYIAFTTASLDEYDAARLYPLFYEQMEHAVMTLCLVVCGALLFDIAAREKK